MNGRDNGWAKFTNAVMGTLFAFGACGLFGVFIDADHLLRCYSDFTWRCFTDYGSKPLHSWAGVCVGVLCGVVCARIAGRVFNLVDNTAWAAPKHY